MAKLKEHQKAIKLRKQGKSYSQIKKELNVSKSTLSLWLRGYPLSEERVRTLRDLSGVRIEKFRKTMQAKKDKRLAVCYDEEKKKLLPLSWKELLLAGLFLYWGEGVKSLTSSVSLNNTDPEIVKFFTYWLTKILRIPKGKIKIYVHLYQDMNIKRELDFWSKELNISRSQFAKPYIKKSKRENLTHKGFGHGTCGVCVGNVRLKERIIMSLKATADYYNHRA
ncbi:hypothetical protein COT63_01025 [Candidatus Shapirobacteria bacterium CG09_land_8_20_14_0_10_38_17]|uniref:Uncharacterized protein n=1 Tax=Candidatus Shapirobacteria bacterium CG09_land_8_20_14_0_10_38_17 TaxID=1974884 RepID=A0A2H0WTH4_9BACT|nr:MAG: hypothetical protein COT63_01025 [Candidatus Shapirobacteria bacterium CG09_land_8_20_14_0_10_38_17]